MDKVEEDICAYSATFVTWHVWRFGPVKPVSQLFLFVEQDVGALSKAEELPGRRIDEMARPH